MNVDALERAAACASIDGGDQEAADAVRAAIVEIERLRAALQSLTEDDPPPTLDEPDTDAEVIIKMREIARAALANS